MIPLRDHHQLSIIPFVTWILIAINVAVFIQMFMMPEAVLLTWINQYAVIPSQVVRGINLSSIFTAMFLHGGIGHLISNMLFLHIFGDNLEERFGHIKYLLFYLACGIVATFAQILVNPASNIPNLGASGAIAGLMGGYLLLFPNNRIDILFPVFFVLQTMTVPAYTMLFYWIVAQFFSGFGSMGFADQGGVAYFAHIGGFLAGMTLTPFFNRRR